jgi:excisionase family DNA binding protein
MTIKDAAEYLGISVKTLERKIAAGDVSVAYVPGATGKQRTFDRAELDRFKAAEAEKAVATSYVISKSRNSDAPSSQALQRVGGEQGMSMLASVLADALRVQAAPADGAPPIPLRDKMTLSFREAAHLSGVPESHLREGYARGILRGAKIGRGVRVTPDDVRKYVEQRMKGKK